MRPEEAEVVLANRAFYEALGARDLPAMAIVWSHEQATCVHPGWHRLDGWSEVRRSWENIFANSRPWSVSCEEVRVRIVGSIAVVACVEVIVPFGGSGASDAARMQATNVFAREDGLWRMIHHHASQSPSGDSERDAEETVN